VRNAKQEYGSNIYWHDNVSIGNWWSDFSGTGIYNIENDTAIVNSDIYPSKSLELISATPITYEVSENWTAKQMTWMAYALNPMHFFAYVDGELYLDGEWDGEPITIVVDEIPGGVHEVIMKIEHLSGHSINETSSVNVTDLTAPEWIVGPSDQVINEGESLSAQFSAEDISGIGDWWTNDSVNFHISEGHLTNNTVLPVGQYGLRVYVEDTFGNVADWEIRIRVLYVPEPTTTTTTTTTTVVTTPTTGTTSTTTTTNETTPPSGDFTTMIIVVAAGGAIVVIVVIVIISKKR
jgi:hypothetical protein